MLAALVFHIEPCILMPSAASYTPCASLPCPSNIDALPSIRFLYASRSSTQARRSWSVDDILLPLQHQRNAQRKMGERPESLSLKVSTLDTFSYKRERVVSV